MAKKVNDYLQSGSAIYSPVREHARRMDDWLGKLLAQVQVAPDIQFPVTLILPNHTKLAIWSKSMLARVIALMEEDWLSMRGMRHSTAKKVRVMHAYVCSVCGTVRSSAGPCHYAPAGDRSVTAGDRLLSQAQQSLIISFVCGTFGPPFRLDLLKRLVMSWYLEQHGCCDPDCHQAGCMGNRFELVASNPLPDGEALAEWLYGASTTDVMVHIIHGKNDRRLARELFKVSLRLQPSDQTKVLIAFIRGGRELLTLEQPEPCPNLFVTGYGNAFNDATFQHYWVNCMKTAKEFGISYFPPNKARTIFIEEYTKVHQ